MVRLCCARTFGRLVRNHADALLSCSDVCMLETERKNTPVSPYEPTLLNSSICIDFHGRSGGLGERAERRAGEVPAGVQTALV